MSKFTDYLASQITPQMTLLEKFNALLKYLEEIDKEGKELSGYDYRYRYEFRFLELENDDNEYFTTQSFVCYSNYKMQNTNFSEFKKLFTNGEILSLMIADHSENFLMMALIYYKKADGNLMYKNVLASDTDGYVISNIMTLDLKITDLNTGKTEVFEV